MKTRGENLIFKNESYAIVRACFAVYRDKGCGFLEARIKSVWNSFASFRVLSGLSR